MIIKIKNKYATVIVRRRRPVQSLFRVKGQRVFCNSWLLLFRGLFTPGETTLLEAPIDADSHVIGDLKARWLGVYIGNCVRGIRTPVVMLVTSSIPMSPRVA